LEHTYALRWDLDSLFPGGSESEEFQRYLSEIREQLAALKDRIASLDETVDLDRFCGIVGGMETAIVKLRQASAFISCLLAQNTADKKAMELRGQVSENFSQYFNLLAVLDEKIRAVDDSRWEEWLMDGRLREIAFVLNERREQAKEKLSASEEAIIQNLSVDGYHAWENLYDMMVGDMVIPVEVNGERKNLSCGQAENLFSDPDRDVRKRVFASWEKAWGEKSEYFAAALNHLAGFRLNVYKSRKWEDVLKEPLMHNRMKKETLAAMWSAVEDNKEPFVAYFNRKAELLGLEKLSWYDLNAPLGRSGRKIPYEEAAETVIAQFGKFSGRMAAFARQALGNRWIEAEDRPGKQPGGFCTSFPDSKQSRIFMTYSGTLPNVFTLAHELGHAFHAHVLAEERPFRQMYGMNVAETASTFAEMIVADHALKNAKTEEEKLYLLDDKIARSVTFFMNIHARFLFETRFYEERKQGPVGARRLNEIMEEAQKEAYCRALAEYHPLFWASKLHFYITDTPFYNFPYTFGYLFTMGIYARALEEGRDFEDRYIALLRDTAAMTVEDLAKKHLNVDLTKKEFWDSAARLCSRDVKEFLRLTEKRARS
jgi:oligoendopeptidase F